MAIPPDLCWRCRSSPTPPVKAVLAPATPDRAAPGGGVRAACSPRCSPSAGALRRSSCLTPASAIRAWTGWPLRPQGIASDDAAVRPQHLAVDPAPSGPARMRRRSLYLRVALAAPAAMLSRGLDQRLRLAVELSPGDPGATALTVILRPRSPRREHVSSPRRRSWSPHRRRKTPGSTDCDARGEVDDPATPAQPPSASRIVLKLPFRLMATWLSKSASSLSERLASFMMPALFTSTPRCRR